MNVSRAHPAIHPQLLNIHVAQNLLRSLAASQGKAGVPDADLRLLLQTVKDTRVRPRAPRTLANSAAR
jgi:hypothetical protein